MFKPMSVPSRNRAGMWFHVWWAQDESGRHCLHNHKTKHAAEQCCKALNRKSSYPGTPRGAREHAAGYYD